MTHPSPESTPAAHRERRTSAAATTSLIFAIFGVVGGCLICGLPPIIAIITGHIGVARTRQGELKGHGMALAGLIMGYVLILPTAVIALAIVVNPASVTDILEGFRHFFENLVARI
ncbi:hypothetical protein GCM10022225_72060 [Plantactinospora mayteni]|uniref:DUF4190 domain-containing protein n=1 Tax=Plantactinospora mayteni TaxID=566021 RepID=A0ABQ4F183_9ACTN|nr:DUF4190 domain-containing protein [Plantactinospora mayteni]GIH00660.1 hypothetical protein Pma05_72320 [Plantactinospora mayteni]